MSKENLPEIEGLFKEGSTIMDAVYISCTSDKIHSIRAKVESSGASFKRIGVKTSPNNGLYSFAEKYVDGNGNVAYIFMLHPREDKMGSKARVVFGNVKVCRGISETGDGYYDLMFENFNCKHS